MKELKTYLLLITVCCLTYSVKGQWLIGEGSYDNEKGLVGRIGGFTTIGNENLAHNSLLKLGGMIRANKVFNGTKTVFVGANFEFTPSILTTLSLVPKTLGFATNSAQSLIVEFELPDLPKLNAVSNHSQAILGTSLKLGETFFTIQGLLDVVHSNLNYSAPLNQIYNVIQLANVEINNLRESNSGIFGGGADVERQISQLVTVIQQVSSGNLRTDLNSYIPDLKSTEVFYGGGIGWLYVKDNLIFQTDYTFLRGFESTRSLQDIDLSIVSDVSLQGVDSDVLDKLLEVLEPIKKVNNAPREEEQTYLNSVKLKLTYDNPETAWQIYALYNYSFSRSVQTELVRQSDGSVQRGEDITINRPSVSLFTVGVALRIPAKGGVLLVK